MSITANDSIGGRANSVQLTIVIPAFNTAKFLARCVSSVTSPENSNNLEIIIIDDGSTDDTVDVADEMGEIFRMFVFYINPTQGSVQQEM
ncbi:MAG TPA: glycosyltransferase family A protein [Bellilinea sp.]|nr:glycosyltransferase family A protein [Bellilinea sp.]